MAMSQDTRRDITVSVVLLGMLALVVFALNHIDNTLSARSQTAVVVRTEVAVVATPAPVPAIEPSAPPRDTAEERRLADDQLWLSRICVHELTWRVEYDCEPMYQVFQTILSDVLGPNPDGSKRPLREAIAFYCKRFARSRTDRAWAGRLVPGQTEPPEGWPTIWGRWDYPSETTGETHAQAWARVYAYAGQVVRGQVTPICDIPVRHWGSRSPELPDYERAQRAIAAGRWRRAYCPGARQGYYAVNGRQRLLALDAQAP
jgi:hypothetical protein